MSIELANESGVDVDVATLEALARHVLAEMRVHPLAELSVLLVDDEAMAVLNERWMQHAGPTDVLAFPMDSLSGGDARGDIDEEDDEPAPTLLGDVVLCPQIAGHQARAAGHSFDDELHLLMTHGVLHLLGYDHEEPEEHREMFSLQATLLASWQAARAERTR